jgi:CRISPR-associated protein Csb1
MWDSTGPKGGLGAKFERAMVSEIVGINAVRGCKTSSRLDPLAIQLQAGPIYQTKEGGWTLDPEKAHKEKGQPVKLGKDGRPSEANHGNVTPSLSEKDRDGEFLAGGVTIDRAEQTVVLSFPALRRLRFPLNGESQSRPEVDVAARTVLAALGLCAAALAAEAGLDLRSRCLLWPNEPLKWEFLGKPGKIEKDIVVSADHAVQLLQDAIQAATEIGLPWRTTPLPLRPSDELVKLVVKSQQLAAQQGGEGGE